MLVKFSALFSLLLFAVGAFVVPHSVRLNRSTTFTKPATVLAVSKVGTDNIAEPEAALGDDDDDDKVIDSIAELAVDSIMTDSYDSSDPVCVDQKKSNKARKMLKERIERTFRAVRGQEQQDEEEARYDL